MKPHYRHTIHNYIPLNTLRIIPIPSISHTLITQQHQIPFQTYPHRYLSNSMERISDRITPLLIPYHTIHKSPLTNHITFFILHTITTISSILHNTSILIPHTILTITLIHHTTLNPSTTHSLQSSLSLPLSPFYYYSTILTLQLHTSLHTTIHTLLCQFIHSYYLPLINYPFHHSHITLTPYSIQHHSTH